MRKIYIIVLLLIFLTILPFNPEQIRDTIIYQNIFSKTSNQPATLPALVIMYDDGFIEDYGKAFYVHRQLDIPAVVAVNPECIGKQGRLGLHHLRDMAASGWEIASHGQFHAAFIYNKLTRAATDGDTRLYVKHPILVEKRYRYKLFNNDKGISETITINGMQRSQGQTFLKLAKPLVHDYPATGTYMMLTESSLKHELLHSKAILEDCGFDVNNFVYPYNGHIRPAVNMAEKYYVSARAGVGHGEKFPMAFINILPFDRYLLKAACFENDLLTDKRMQILMETTVAKKGLLIMYAHSKSPHFSTDRLKDIIKIAREKGITITTLSDVLEYRVPPAI